LAVAAPPGKKSFFTLGLFAPNYMSAQSISIASMISRRKDAFRMLNLNSIMIGTKQPKMLAAFYEKLIGKPADMVDSESGFSGWQVGSAYFSVLEHSEMGGNSKDPGRLMFNFETMQVKEEFERIKAIGGVVIREPYEMGGGWIATLADPEGNYFQLVTPMD
jgi:predicted enzyme related to lactoylglutathione lyase